MVTAQRSGSESWRDDGGGAGDCPQVSGCWSPASKCVLMLQGCQQSLREVSAPRAPRVTESLL
eukprot:528356-Alexandrium_andersonii.AAC.1